MYGTVLMISHWPLNHWILSRAISQDLEDSRWASLRTTLFVDPAGNPVYWLASSCKLSRPVKSAILDNVHNSVRCTVQWLYRASQRGGEVQSLQGVAPQTNLNHAAKNNLSSNRAFDPRLVVSFLHQQISNNTFFIKYIIGLIFKNPNELKKITITITMSYLPISILNHTMVIPAFLFSCAFALLLYRVQIIMMNKILF